MIDEYMAVTTVSKDGSAEFLIASFELLVIP